MNYENIYKTPKDKLKREEKNTENLKDRKLENVHKIYTTKSQNVDQQPVEN